MRTFMLYALIAMLSFGLCVNEASARRFGGGRSFGVQRSHSSLFSPRAPQSKSYASQANTRKWGGLMRGLLIGGLLASLFMGHGLAAGLLSWLALAALALFLINFLRRKMQPGYQYASSMGNNPHQPNHFFTSGQPQSTSSYPVGFEPEVFLREAKVMFIRLQAAYDQKNRQDLMDFTAPEVFAEIDMQLKEHSDEVNITEVIGLNAELLDASKQTDSLIASVRFTGSIKENNTPTPLDEIWHFRQFAGSHQWVVGGIQQQVVEAG